MSDVRAIECVIAYVINRCQNKSTVVLFTWSPRIRVHTSGVEFATITTSLISPRTEEIIARTGWQSFCEAVRNIVMGTDMGKSNHACCDGPPTVMICHGRVFLV